ncbi:MAG: hypothetical protein ABIH88_03460 [Patescibacteria group bacterium]|nr:hypothetical protein [Patescibacteria group bacterium]
MNLRTARSKTGKLLLDENGAPFFLLNRNMPKETTPSPPLLAILKIFFTGKHCRLTRENAGVKTTITIYWWWLILVEQLAILDQRWQNLSTAIRVRIQELQNKFLILALFLALWGFGILLMEFLNRSELGTYYSLILSVVALVAIAGSKKLVSQTTNELKHLTIKLKAVIVEEKPPKPKLKEGERKIRILMAILVLMILNIFLVSFQTYDVYAVLVLFFPIPALAISKWIRSKETKNWIAVSIGLLGVEISMFSLWGLALLPIGFILRYWIKGLSSPVAWNPEDVVMQAKPHRIHFFDLIPKSLPEGKIARILAILNLLWWAQFIYGYRQGIKLVGYTLTSTQLIVFSHLKITLFGHEIKKNNIDLARISQSASGTRSTWLGDCEEVDFGFAFGGDAESSVIRAARPKDHVEQTTNAQRTKLQYKIS